jgi:hypothetical protein
MLGRHSKAVRPTLLTLRYLGAFSELATAREQLRRLLYEIDRSVPTRDTAALRDAIRSLLRGTMAIEAEDERLRHDCQIALCDAIVGRLEEAE